MSNQQFDAKSLSKFFRSFIASAVLLFIILLLMTLWKGPYITPDSGHAQQTESHS